MSLFPDDYPDQPLSPKERATCCDLVTAPEGIDLFTWRLAHAFGHTRSAVGVNVLAGLAGCTGRVASLALNAAEEAGWLIRVVPEPYQKEPPPLWLGRLRQRS